MTSLQYSVVDAFTSTPFQGNSAAVIVFDSNTSPPDNILQNIAAEFNLSETAYVFPIAPERGDFYLRWFTPKVEVALCGHATLAAAYTLFSSQSYLLKDINSIQFTTNKSGVLIAKHLPDGRIELEFPVGEVVAIDEALDRQIIEDSITIAFAAEEKPVITFMGQGNGDSYSGYLVVEIAPGIDLRNAVVNTEIFMKLAPKFLVIVVTQRGDDVEETFKSRVFAPALGIFEDPVTGSAHSFIAKYWAERVKADGKSIPNMLGRQVSARSGEVGVSLANDGTTCQLQGRAVLVARGEIFV
ncbi:Diaminopimelate epimerase-like protein [Hysterangium stoloniferum]|nr:Diaminopimelate epimerase-like protein [Hysterangium stoloniferum]